MRQIIAILISILFVIGCNNDDGKKYLRDVYLSYHLQVMALSDTMQIALLFYPEHTNAGVPDGPVEWTSTDTTVVSVRSNGTYTAILTARGIGEVTIKARLGDFVTRTNIIVDLDNGVSNTIFLNWCLERFDKNNDGILQGTEIVNLIEIDATELSATNNPISFDCIELFTSLRKFKATHLIISKLDLSQNASLTEIDISESEIKELDISNNAEVRFLDCHACPSLSNIIFAPSTQEATNQMRTINCQRCNLTSLNVSSCSLLEYLDCSQNKLTELDVSNNMLLKQLCCTGNNISSVRIWEDADTEEFVADDGVPFTY